MAKLGGTSDDSIHLMERLVKFMQAIDVTRRLLPKVPTPVLARVSWDQAVNIAQMLAGEAIVVGKLWTEEVSDVKELEQNMQEFFGLLQRLIMLGFGAIQGAGGVTLGSHMRLSMNRMTDLSVILIKEVVFSYDERGRNEDKVSKMIAAVWEAYFDMSKVPSNNATAIGEALGRATVLIKENLRVMKQAMERVASIEVKDKAADESGSSSEQQKEADSCDTPGTIKDEAGGDESSSLKELEDVKDEASVDDDSELKDTSSSSDKNRESSGHQGWGFKDVASGNEGSSLKELEKGSVKDEAPVDDGSELKDKDSVDDGSELKDEDSADEFFKFKPDEMTVDDLTSHAVTEVVIMLQALGQAMISLSKREDKGAVAEFVDSLENMVHVGSSLIKEAVLSKDSEKQNENPKLTATLMEYSVAMMKSQRTPSNIPEATEALAQVTQSINETAVGDSLCDLKNTPPNNAETELAEALASLSMKENTSKMEEQKEASGEAGSSTEEQKDEASGKDVTDEVSGEDESTSGPSDYVELTPEEITTAQIATDAISGIVEMMSLLGPAVSGLQSQEKKGTVDDFVASLEKILNLSIEIQQHSGELKMCVFHPQEISALRYAFGNIYEAMRQISVELHHVAKDLHFPPEFSQAWNDAVPKMKQLGKELDRRENQE